jgi:hypothetical protein
MRRRRVLVLLGVLLFHAFGALTWVVSLGFSSDAGTDSQFSKAVLLGAATWLVAALLIAWLCWSGRWAFSLAVPFVWWIPSFLLMVAVVYSGSSGGYQSEVYATATFDESAGCLHYWRSSEGWRLNNDNVADCFPTQTTAKKAALIACFNTYERDHSDHDGWPEKNMRGCTWDGLTAVPARNVASLAFGKVVAVPAAPRAGKRLVLSVLLTRSDSAAKKVQRLLEDDDNPALGAAVTVDGKHVPIESVDGCSSCRLPGNPRAEYWFSEPRMRMRFTVPKTAEGKRLKIKMTAAQGDTPTATKVVTFTVRP